MGFIYGIKYFVKEFCRKPISLHAGLATSLPRRALVQALQPSSLHLHSSSAGFPRALENTTHGDRKDHVAEVVYQLRHINQKPVGLK